MSWHLDNIYKRNAEFPYTFYIPSKQVIDILSIGDIVKLRFVGETENDDLTGERMWVKITERNGENFKGILTNEAYDLKDLEIGQEVLFKAENICDTEYKDPASSEWDYYFDTKVVVSNDVLNKREFNFMLRDSPNGEHDSGWTILSGYEDDEFVNNPDNLQCVSIGVILNIDNSILKFIDESPMCAYERNDKGDFYRIEDYDWDGYLNG
ncbi:immunity protein Imm33 domain-containing protein [Metabacillus fastidiosus]|uniref:immunity protein Imm33 domain-containing protein n=1 Tax=Metabacillus fastidiosus TaxID=1458 RepID=UPI003D2BA5B6